MGVLQYPVIKREMILNGDYRKIQKIFAEFYKKGTTFEDELLNLINFDEIIGLSNKEIDDYCIMKFCLKYGIDNPIKITCYKQMQHAKQRKRKRIANSINFALKRGYTLIFGTFTFTDEFIKLNPRTRRNYINNYLKQYDGYIANIDYGEEGQREHYHAIIFINPKFINDFIYDWEYNEKKKRKFKVVKNLEELMQVKEIYNYGRYDFELVEMNDDDLGKVKNYIVKLTNHALKVEQTRLLFELDNLKDLNKEKLKTKTLKYDDFIYEDIELKFY